MSPTYSLRIPSIKLKNPRTSKNKLTKVPNPAKGTPEKIQRKASGMIETKEIKEKLIFLFNKYKIEYRPIVGGNLLRQPYLKGYQIDSNSKHFNADILHENGVYVGNSQFVTNKNMKLLNKILGELKWINLKI